jgi:hypothetical protein
MLRHGSIERGKRNVEIGEPAQDLDKVVVRIEHVDRVPQMLDNVVLRQVGGVIVAKYRPDGAVKTGDFQLVEPSGAEMERRRKLT